MANRKQGMNSNGRDTKFSENRAAWIRIETGTYVIILGDDIGEGSDVVFYIPPALGRKFGAVSINLTSLTSEELVALRELFNTALDWAEPVVAQRDKEARIAWENGDDSHARNYRALPTVVYRKRPFGEHGESLLERPQGVPEGSGGRGGDSAARVRGAGSGVAEHGALSQESEDNREASDDTP